MYGAFPNQKQRTNKLIVVLSEDKILYQSLVDNIDDLDISIIHAQDISEAKKILATNHKTTVTIVDKWSGDTAFITNYSKYIFSFAPNKLKHSILFKKPHRMADFIAEIKKSISNNKLFCIINGGILDELRSTIIFPTEILRLTEQENIIMRAFVLSQDFFITREMLLKNIWKYSENSETTAVESCMNKLRNKLPQGMLEQSKDGYQLLLESFL